MDFEKVKTAFELKTNAAITSIEWGSGDAHRQGRVVAIIHVGSDKFVYKPRPMRIDVAYNQFLAWYMSLSEALSPMPTRILDCGIHGYAEYIKARPCGSQTEIQNFYNRLGSLIGIAWLLGITDLHLENVIAAGDKPYLVDVETMFDSPVRSQSPRHGAHDIFDQASRDLMFRTGLLPAQMKSANGVFDVSAIGARGEQAHAVEVLMMENFGKDDVRLVSKPGIVAPANNSPCPDDTDHRPHHYTENIIAGFKKAISAFKKHNTFLMAPDSVLKAFEGAQVRWVPRATMDYAKLLEKITHPAVLGDAVDCDMLMGGELWSVLNFAPHTRTIISSEIADLWNYDIPYFWTQPTSTDLYDSRGKIYKNFFKVSGIAEIQRRLKTVGKSEEAQICAIRLSLKSAAPVLQMETPILPKRKNIVRNDLVELASEIGTNLIKQAHYIGDVPFWVGLTPLDDKNYTAGVLPPTFYDGAPGIGLFLGYLFRETNDQAFRKVALDVHKHVRYLLRTKSGTPYAGAFSGFASLLYADLHLTKILELEPSAEVNSSFEYLRELIETDDNFDIIAGAAGALIVALRCHTVTGNKMAKVAASAAAKKLYDSAEAQKEGMAWDTLKTFNFSKKLGGLSHGVSGIAWALAEWGDFTKSKKWRDLARKAFAYEQSLFDTKHQTWTDVRKDTNSCFWCYGAPGIGLAANKMRSVLGKSMQDRVLEQAVKATWKQRHINNHCLCHGILGNAEIFRMAGETKKSDAFIYAAVNEYRNSKIWSCGLPDGAVVPGFMCGLAGIGYGLLRHTNPDKFPNLLGLEPPK